MNRTFKGSCHCGMLRYQGTLARDISEYAPRACDCSFCLKHGAAYLSDPKGRLQISFGRDSSLGQYHQGSGQARFLFCRDCGVLVAVTFTQAESTFAAVNALTVDGRPTFLPMATVSPQKLSADDKVMRWKQAWFYDVEVSKS